MRSASILPCPDPGPQLTFVQIAAKVSCEPKNPNAASCPSFRLSVLITEGHAKFRTLIMASSFRPIIQHCGKYSLAPRNRAGFFDGDQSYASDACLQEKAVQVRVGIQIVPSRFGAAFVARRCRKWFS